MMADLRPVLAAGNVEGIKSVLPQGAPRIAVQELPGDGDERPRAALEVLRDMRVMLSLTSGSAEGGTRTPMSVMPTRS